MKVRYGKHGKVIMKKLKLSSPYIKADAVWKAMILNPYKAKPIDKRSKSQSPPVVRRSVDVGGSIERSQQKNTLAHLPLAKPIVNQQKLTLPKLTRPLQKSPPKKSAPVYSKLEKSSIERSMKQKPQISLLEGTRQSYVVNLPFDHSSKSA